MNPHDAHSNPSLAPMPDVLLGTSIACDPPLQRRTFLNLLGGTGVVGAFLSKLPAGASLASGTSPRSLELDQVSLATFHPRVGSTFHLMAPSGERVEGRLIQVEELGAVGLGPSRRAPFSLKFEFAGSAYFPQRIYAIQHETLGSLELFLVPVKHQEGTLILEAIFT